MKDNENTFCSARAHKTFPPPLIRLSPQISHVLNLKFVSLPQNFNLVFFASLI